MAGENQPRGENLYFPAEFFRTGVLAAHAGIVLPVLHHRKVDFRELGGYPGEVGATLSGSVVKLLVEKERFDCFQDAALWFHQCYNDEFGIVEAYVTTAVPLTDNDMEALRQKLGRISGRKVHLIARVDPSLIGGVRVEMDGKRYDNTIQDRLGRLKRSLTQGL